MMKIANAEQCDAAIARAEVLMDRMPVDVRRDAKDACELEILCDAIMEYEYLAYPEMRLKAIEKTLSAWDDQ